MAVRERGTERVSLVETEKENVDRRSFNKGCIMTLSHAKSATGGLTLCCVYVAGVLVLCSLRLINLFLSAFGHNFLATNFISCVTFLNGKAADGTLDAFDIINMEIDTFLEYV